MQGTDLKKLRESKNMTLAQVSEQLIYRLPLSELMNEG